MNIYIITSFSLKKTYCPRVISARSKQINKNNFFIVTIKNYNLK